MDNLSLLRQTIRFQRTALQNSLAMLNAVQQHGESLLKTTLDHSPWLPGEGRDACLFWTGLWTNNLAGVTDLVDKNLATMERLTARRGNRRPATAEPDQGTAGQQDEPATGESRQAGSAAAPGEDQPREDQPPTDQEMPPAAEKEHMALATSEGQALVAQPPSGLQPETPHGKPPAGRKRSSEPKT